MQSSKAMNHKNTEQNLGSGWGWAEDSGADAEAEVRVVDTVL